MNRIKAVLDTKTLPSRRRLLAFGASLGAAALDPAWVRWAEAQPAVAPPQRKLITRPIPRTGEQLPVIGLGTVKVFDVGNDMQKRAACAAVLRALTAGGGKLVDTAPSYGAAEGVVGDLLAETKLRKNVFLATKLERYDRQTGLADLQASLKKLHVDAVDLMQLHNVSDAKQDLAMLRDWKAQGLCRYTGITTTFQSDFAAAEAVIKRERPDFVQIDYALDDREVEKRIIPAAADVGAAIITALPFGRGRLFDRVKGKTLPDWARDIDASSWAQFFLKFLLGNPAVTALIPGTASADHVADNLDAGRGRLPDEAERERMWRYIDSLR